MPNYVHYIIFCIILYPILKVNTAYYISFILLAASAQQADVSIEQPQWIRDLSPEHLQVE